MMIKAEGWLEKWALKVELEHAFYRGYVCGRRRTATTGLSAPDAWKEYVKRLEDEKKMTDLERVEINTGLEDLDREQELQKVFYTAFMKGRYSSKSFQWEWSEYLRLPEEGECTLY